jgi:hypothetical protein
MSDFIWSKIKCSVLFKPIWEESRQQTLHQLCQTLWYFGLLLQSTQHWNINSFFQQLQTLTHLSSYTCGSREFEEILVVILVRKKLNLLFQKIEMEIAVVQPCVSSKLLWMRNDVPCKSLAHWDHSSHTLSRSTTTCLYDRAVSPLLQVILMKSMPSDCIHAQIHDFASALSVRRLGSSITLWS